MSNHSHTTQYHAVDLMKYVCALLVIVVHTFPFYETLPTVGFFSSNIVGRIIIPFFFVSAGYFLYLGLQHKDETYFRNYIKRLIKLYLIWSLVYIPFGLIKVSTMVHLSGWLYLGALVVAIFNIGTYYHLWYMAALIFAMIFCHTFLKKFSMKALIVVGGILFCFGCLETYHGLITNETLLKGVNLYFTVMFTTRNGLFFGVLFVALGMALAKNQNFLKIPHPLVLSVLSFILLCIEAFSVRHFQLAIDYNMYFSTIPFIVCWFTHLLQVKLNLPFNFKRLRESSTIIYFSHAMYLELVPLVLSWIGFAGIYQVNGAVRFFSVLPLTLITTEVIRHHLPWLK